MHNIILDTDFLLHSVNNRVDIFSEFNRICDFKYKLYIIDKTINELKNKKNEKLIIRIIKGKVDLIMTNENKTVDELILGLNIENLVVCTNDTDLKEKLKKRNIPIITLRQGKFLVIQNVL